MYRIVLLTVLLSATQTGTTLGTPPDDNDNKEVKHPLPRLNKAKWDVRVFEESPTFAIVKRQVKGNQVTWVLENKRDLGTEITFGYQAALLDEDGVKLGTIPIDSEPFLFNMSKGERNRFTLNLPPNDKLSGVRKVVIKNGPL